MTEWKSLRELDVQPGDVVMSGNRLVARIVDIVVDVARSDFCNLERTGSWGWNGPIWRVISRAADTQPYSGDEPIPLRDMSTMQKGLLLEALISGKVIEFFSWDAIRWEHLSKPLFLSGNAYRVRPEPPIITVDLIADGKVVGSIEMEGGKINPTSAQWEKADD